MEATGKVLSTDSIMDDDVVTRDGENLGKIQDLMIDIDRGAIAYAVLSFGGLFGIGDKLFAVPWNAFNLQGHTFVLNADRAALERAPGFDKDNWPDSKSAAWQEVNRFYSSAVGTSGTGTNPGVPL